MFASHLPGYNGSEISTSIIWGLIRTIFLERKSLKRITGLIYSTLLFAAGWLFNFVFDIQFALGVAAGWLMREGYSYAGSALLELIR